MKPKIISMKTQSVILVAAMFFIGFLFFQIIPYENNKVSENDVIMLESAKFQDAREFWRAQMTSSEASSVYTEFKEIYKQFDFSKQHSAAHIIGELLYEIEGIEGLAVCDNSFAFGCFHGFFGNAIQEGGVEAITELDLVCIDKYGPYGTGCQHGIGHGILEYLGHDTLVDALELCEYTTQEEDLFGCTSGLFMEYNIPIVFTADDVYSEMREVDLENPYDPCNTIVPDKFKKSCYFEIAQWWVQVFNNDYSKVGSLCEGILDNSHRRSCFLGFGTVGAYMSKYKPEKAIAICKEASRGNEGSEFNCRSGASWAFWSIPEYREKANLLCDGLDEKTKELCIVDSDLIGTGERHEDD